MSLFDPAIQKFAEQDGNIHAVNSAIEQLRQGQAELASRIAKLETPQQAIKCGCYIPWYGQEIRLRAVDLAVKNPDVPFLFTLNPASGPGTAPRADLIANIDAVRSANKNAKIYAYIFTKWATRSPADVKADVLRYIQFYGLPRLDGVMWDETSADPAYLAYYEDITDHARANGLKEARGNTGTHTYEALVKLLDVVSICEDKTPLAEAELARRTYYGRYPKTKFNYILHTQATFDEAHFKQVMKYCGTVLFTEWPGPPYNPYNRPPSTIDQQVALLASQ